MASSCRFCRSGPLTEVLDLGSQPACEYFPPLDDRRPDPLFPLRLALCAACGLAQLADDAVLPDEPVGTEPAALREQRADAVARLHARGVLPPRGATVAEGWTPHGGSWVPDLAAHGLRRAEPGVPADVVVDGAFGLMHAADQRVALRELVDRVAPGGVLLFGFHSVEAILRELQWHAVRLGHYAYYSTPVVRDMLAELGFGVTSAHWFPLYGGTVVVVARRGGEPDDSVAEMIAVETATGVRDPAAYAPLRAAVTETTTAVRDHLRAAAAAGRRVYGYGAASRAVTLLAALDADGDQPVAVADASPAKWGRRIPGTGVGVVAPADLVAARPDEVLVLVPDLLAEVRHALPEIEAQGGTWTDCFALGNTAGAELEPVSGAAAPPPRQKGPA